MITVLIKNCIGRMLSPIQGVRRGMYNASPHTKKKGAGRGNLPLSDSKRQHNRVIKNKEIYK